MHIDTHKRRRPSHGADVASVARLFLRATCLVASAECPHRLARPGVAGETALGTSCRTCRIAPWKSPRWRLPYVVTARCACDQIEKQANRPEVRSGRFPRCSAISVERGAGLEP